MTTDRPVESRWWYGVAALPIAIVFLGVFFLVIVQLGSNSESLASLLESSGQLFVLYWLAGVWSVLLFFASGLIQLLFPLSLAMDIRAIRRSECSWTPSWAYGLIGIPPIALLLSSNVSNPQVANLAEHLLTLYVLSVIGPLGYLYQRHRHLGVPFGKQEDTEAPSPNQRDYEDELSVLDERSRISRWWYGVVVPPAFSIIGRFGAAAEAGWIALVFWGGSLILVPAFALSMYLDARAIVRSQQNWNPRPLFWGVLGLVPLAGLLFDIGLLSLTVMVPIALAYLYRRNQRIGLR